MRRTAGPDPWSISLEVNRGRYDDGPGISRVECPSCNSDIVRTRILELTECAWAGPQAGKPTSLTG